MTRRTNRYKIDHEEGIAYSLIAIVAFIVFAALLYVILGPMFNAVIDVINTMVGEGGLSHSTIATVDWSISLFYLVPVISIIGISIWGYIRAIERGGGQ